MSMTLWQFGLTVISGTCLLICLIAYVFWVREAGRFIPTSILNFLMKAPFVNYYALKQALESKNSLEKTILKLQKDVEFWKGNSSLWHDMYAELKLKKYSEESIPTLSQYVTKVQNGAL